MHILWGADHVAFHPPVSADVVVGGLEQTEILNLIAQLIEKWSKGNLYLMVAIILWISAIASVAYKSELPERYTICILYECNDEKILIEE